jgi:hypothetical protein
MKREKRQVGRHELRQIRGHTGRNKLAETIVNISKEIRDETRNKNRRLCKETSQRTKLTLNT